MDVRYWEIAIGWGWDAQFCVGGWAVPQCKIDQDFCAYSCAILSTDGGVTRTSAARKLPARGGVRVDPMYTMNRAGYSEIGLDGCI